MGEETKTYLPTQKIRTLIPGAAQRLKDKYLLKLGSLYNVRSGIESLDESLDGGWPREEYSVLGGLSGHGKTTLAMQFARQAAEDDPDSAVIVCSPEMRNDALAEMELCALIGHSRRTLKRTPSVLESDVVESAKKIACDNLFLAQMPRGTHISALYDTVEALGKMQPVSLVIVDYAQFVLGRLDVGRRQRFAVAQDIVEVCEDVSKIRCKTTGVEKSPAVLLTSQVNASRDRNGKITDMTLRESALFEHGAAAVVFFVREFDENGDEEGAYFKVTKARFGKLGRIPVKTRPGHYWVGDEDPLF